MVELSPKILFLIAGTITSVLTFVIPSIVLNGYSQSLEIPEIKVEILIV
jgi:hypothetical protein